MTELNTTDSKSYPSFYLVMLIISTFIIFVSVYGALSELFQLTQNFNMYPGYTICSLVSLLGIIITLIALGLLWARKGAVGVQVITIGYVLNAIGAVGAMFFSQGIVQAVIAEVNKGVRGSSEREFNALLAPFFVYTEYALAVVVLVTLTILWRVAIKKAR